MTMKNSEFTFDLQNFASNTTVPSAITPTPTATIGGFTGSNMASVVTSANNSIGVYGGWALTDAVTVNNVFDASGTKLSVSSYDHNANFTYYGFNGANGSYSIATLSAAGTITSDNSSTTYISQTASIPSGVAFTGAAQASPLTLVGSGATNEVSIQGIGSIAGFGNDQSVALSRSGNNLNMTGVNGTITLSADGNTLKQTVNGAAVNATLDSSGLVTIKGDNWGNPTFTADTVSFGSIDTVQTWVVNDATYSSVTAGTATTGEQITVSGSAGNYLNVSVGANNSVALSAGGTGNSVRDTIGVNGTIIAGAAKAGAIIAAGEEASSPLTATIGSAAASINVGGNPSINGAANVGAGAVVTISASGNSTIPVISGISQLASGGNWLLGANATVGQLLNDTVTFSSANGTITADSAGTKVATLGYGGTATLSGVGDHTVNANGQGNWTLGAGEEANVVGSFDSAGNATVSGATLIGGSNKSLAIGANDTMSLGSGSQVSLDANGVVTGVNTLAAGSSWLVKNGSPRTVTLGDSAIAFASQNSAGVLGEIQVSTVTSGSQLAGIDSLSGNVTVSSATISGLNVAGTTWSISGESNSTVGFDSTGKMATLGANTDSQVTVTAAATDASVSLSFDAGATVGGVFNGAQVYMHDTDGKVGVQLQSDATVAGILGITDLASGATVTGDNEFDVNNNFHVRKAATNVANANTQFTLGGSSSITVQNVVDGDAYTVTGASGNTIVYDIDSSVVSGGTAKVNVNSAAVTVTASSTSSLGNAYIAANYSDDVVKVGGVKLNDTVSSSGDKNFSVVYDTSNVSSSGSDTYVMTVNDATVSLKAANIASGTSEVTMAVDNSSTMPIVTISRGIANSSTVTVGRGVYNVGSSAAVTINDATGYLYVNENGNVTSEDASVAEIRQLRDNAINSMVSTLHGAASVSGTAFHDFYNLYYNNDNSVFSGWAYTVASYENATTTSRAASISPSGVNIYGDSALGDKPNSVTLESFLNNSIDIEHIEGVLSNQATLKSAVIDVSKGNNSVVAIGMNESYDKFATNHTVLGSGSKSTIVIGERATGDNYIKAGNGGNFISNKGGKASIYGGTGSDTIYAGPSDHVEGGSGADYFYDTNALEISDYNFNEGDVIIASKLSTTANLDKSNVSVDGNKIAIAGGSTITVGSGASYDEATSTSAVIANASNGNNRTLLIWAGNYDSEVNASEFAKGALMFADQNGGAADTIIGSAYADTIYVGGNDSVYSGTGNDVINIDAVSASSGRRGATVVLSEGRNDINGWIGGFDNESGANVIAFSNSSSTAANINFKTKSGVVVGYADGASLNFNGISASEGNTGAYDFLVGQEKVTFIASNETVSVQSDDAIANYYKGEKAAGIYVGESVNSALNIDLNSANFTNVTSLNLHNESKATVIGTAANESITLVGSADAGAGKSVAAGDGNDLIVSGGNSTANAGNYLFFGSYGGYNFGGGKDTIENFGFYRGKSSDMDLASADVLYLGDSSNFKGINVAASKATVSLGDSDQIVINANFATSYDSNIVRARFGNSDTVLNVKAGLTSGTNTFTYDGETNVFYGGSRGKDTLKVASDLNNVNIWINDKNFDTNVYNGVNVLDASNLNDTKATLAGNALDSNVIYSASSGNTSLWGGGGESNTLVGGNGEDTFFYFKVLGYTDNDGVKHASNDVIQNVQNNDIIWLYDVALSDLVSADIENGKITVTLNDGSALTVNGMSTETKFKVSNGQGGWDEYTAVSSGNERYWK